MSKRIYVVEVNLSVLHGYAQEEGAKPATFRRLVNASTPAAAERAIYGKAINARYAEQADLLDVSSSDIVQA